MWEQQQHCSLRPEGIHGAYQMFGDRVRLLKAPLRQSGQQQEPDYPEDYNASRTNSIRPSGSQSRGVQQACRRFQPVLVMLLFGQGQRQLTFWGRQKQRANIALAQEASLTSVRCYDLLNNPETGLLNLKGKMLLKRSGHTQQFDAQVEQLAMSLPDEQARNAFSCSRRSSSAFSSLRRPGNEIGK